MEFQIGGQRYRSRLLCAFDQWQLLSRLKPILPALHGMDHGMRLVGAGVGDITGHLAPLLQAGDDDMRAVFRSAVRACDRHDGDDWLPLTEMPSLPALMAITASVVSTNFGAFFAMERPNFQASSYDGPSYVPVTMPNGEDWLFRPVLRGLCKAESLYDGTLHIEQIAKLSDAIEVEEENQARMRVASIKNKK